MRRSVTAMLLGGVLLAGSSLVWGYVEAPHTLGLVCRDSTNIVLMEVSRVNKEKGLIIYKKVKDIKGTHRQEEIKHNIGQRGFHPREWQNVMNWADIGKKAVFFHNGGASETCIGNYWYQCYPEGEWWAMSHAEPFLLRTYCGDVDKLAGCVTEILQGKEVIVPCFADGSKDQLHQRKGKLQRLRASLKLLDYNARRDFVAFGGDGEEFEEFKTIVLLAESSPGWKFVPAAQARSTGDRWRQLAFDDAAWRGGKTPIGYGEEELGKRRGTLISEQGQEFYFRRAFNIPSDLLNQKGVIFRLTVASDDSATIYLNGMVIDQDPEPDHEFTYWNRDVELPARQLKAGTNFVAAAVRNKQGSSDLYFDLELSAQVPIPKPPKQPAAVVAASNGATNKPAPSAPLVALPRKSTVPVNVDTRTRTLTIPCLIAPRKLPNLQEKYPIEVVATYPAPAGQKAHETVVTFDGILPSDVHKALEQLGLKPGQPARGEGAQATGPEVMVFLELPGNAGHVPLEKVLVDSRSGKPIPALRWHFTGSAMKQPDPEKNERVYGADLTGTLLTIFPVTDDAVLQSHLTMKDEANLKLEIAPGVLPAAGSPAKLVLQAR